jgi:hypothetical protein
MKEKEFLQGLKPIWGCVDVGAKAPTPKEKCDGLKPASAFLNQIHRF